MITRHGLGHHKHDNPPGYAFDDNHTLHGLGLSNHKNPAGHALDGSLRLGERMGSFGTGQSLEAEDSAGRESHVKAPMSTSFFVLQHHHLHYLVNIGSVIVVAQHSLPRKERRRSGN